MQTPTCQYHGNRSYQRQAQSLARPSMRVIEHARGLRRLGGEAVSGANSKWRTTSVRARTPEVSVDSDGNATYTIEDERKHIRVHLMVSRYCHLEAIRLLRGSMKKHAERIRSDIKWQDDQIARSLRDEEERP